MTPAKAAGMLRGIGAPSYRVPFKVFCIDIGVFIEGEETMNFLEQLVAEWYEYQGYFVRSNARTRKRPKGGYDIELDVLAYNLSNDTLLHIETSGDADSWAERKYRFLKKKFILTREEYEAIIGHKVNTIRKIAIVGFSRSTKMDLNWGIDIDVVLIPDLMTNIADKLRSQYPMTEAVPEGFPILRSIQMVLHYGLTK